MVGERTNSVGISNTADEEILPTALGDGKGEEMGYYQDMMNKQHELEDQTDACLALAMAIMAGFVVWIVCFKIPEAQRLNREKEKNKHGYIVQLEETFKEHDRRMDILKKELEQK